MKHTLRKSRRDKKPEGWWTNSRGYIEGFVRIDGVRKEYKQHRWRMEQHIERPLEKGESVHHINGDRADNRIENLQIVEHGEHTRNHNLERTYKNGYKQNLSDEERQARSERMRNMRRKNGRVTSND